MKRFLVPTSLLAAALIVGASDAQAGLELTAGGGASIPMGDFGDAADPSWGLGASLGTSMLPFVTVGVDAGYHKFSTPDEAPGDLSTSLMRGSGFIKIKPPSVAMAPYLKGMAGLYRFKTDGELIPGTPIDDTNTDFGIAAGAGLQFGGTGPAKAFIEGMLHHVMTEDKASQFIEVRAGLAIGLGLPGPM